MKPGRNGPALILGNCSSDKCHKGAVHVSRLAGSHIVYREIITECSVGIGAEHEFWNGSKAGDG